MGMRYRDLPIFNFQFRIINYYQRQPTRMGIKTVP